MRDVAKRQLAEYGYQLTDDNRLAKGEKILGLQVTFKKDRMRVDTVTGGHKMFTGVDLCVFVSKFFAAVKIK